MVKTESIWIGPLAFALIVACTSTFYHVHDRWDVSTAIYFSAQTLLGCNYGGLEQTFLSKAFSLGVYILGTTLIAGAVSVFATDLMRNAKLITTDERKKNRLLPAGFISPFKPTTCSLVMLWCAIGVSWGLFYEKFDVPYAFYFAIGAMSARGDPDPVLECTDDGRCNLGLPRAAFYFVYCVVGVNLYILFMSDFAGVLCEQAVRDRERRLLQRPLTQEEFDFALSLRTRPRPGSRRSRHRPKSRSVLRFRPTSSHVDAVPNFTESDGNRNGCGEEDKGKKLLERELKSAKDEATSGENEEETTDQTLNHEDDDDDVIDEMGDKADKEAKGEEEEEEEEDEEEEGIDLKDLIILELLRMEKVDSEFVSEIRDVFRAIDVDGNGVLSRGDLLAHKKRWAAAEVEELALPRRPDFVAPIDGAPVGRDTAIGTITPRSPAVKSPLLESSFSTPVRSYLVDRDDADQRSRGHGSSVNMGVDETDNGSVSGREKGDWSSTNSGRSRMRSGGEGGRGVGSAVHYNELFVPLISTPSRAALGSVMHSGPGSSSARTKRDIAKEQELRLGFWSKLGMRIDDADADADENSLQSKHKEKDPIAKKNE